MREKIKNPKLKITPFPHKTQVGRSLRERLRSILCAHSPSEAASEMPPYLSFQLQNYSP
jgi:hypothetical protein